MQATLGVRMSGLDDTDIAALEAQLLAERKQVEQAVEQATGAAADSALPPPPPKAAAAAAESAKVSRSPSESPANTLPFCAVRR